MANVTMFIVAQGKDLEPGKTAQWHWNNTPQGGVIALSVDPIISFQNNDLIDKKPAIAEVRNVKYNFKKAIAKVQSSELEVHYEVHNLSEYRIDYVVRMAVIQ